MRVTESTKRDNVLGNIQKNSSRLQDLQTKMATGQKINRTSDDPVGATILQDIHTNITRKEQMARNIDTNISWLERCEVELGHLGELLTKARTLVVSQAGDSASYESRVTVAQELRSIRQALIDAGNAKNGKLYLFSGTKTLTKPLRINNPIQDAKVVTQGVEQEDVGQLLDVQQFKATFDGFSSNPYRIRVTKTGSFGYARFVVSDDGGQTWSKEQMLVPTFEVWNPDGLPSDKVKLKFADDQGLLGELLPSAFNFMEDNTFLFDVEDFGVVFPEGIEFVFFPNPPLSYDGNSKKKEVLVADGTTLPLNITAEELFFRTDDGESVNVFEVFSALERALESNDSRAISDQVEQMEKTLNQILKKRADIGNTYLELSKAKDKLEEQIFSGEKRATEIRDIDMAESLVELNIAELNNKVSLDAGGRLIQPTLMEFLR